MFTVRVEWNSKGEACRLPCSLSAYSLFLALLSLSLTHTRTQCCPRLFSGFEAQTDEEV